MSRDDITPERLDAVMDGADATTDAERELLHVAAQLRAAVPAPSDDLRRRVAALGEPVAGPTVRAVPRRRWAWMPALGAAVAVLIGAVAFTVSRDGQAPDNAAGPASSSQSHGDTALREGAPKQTQEFGPAGATEALPTDQPYNWFVPQAGADTALDALRDVARRTGATVTITRTDVTTIVVDLPIDNRAATLAALTDALNQAGAVGAPLAPIPTQDSFQIDLRTVQPATERP